MCGEAAVVCVLNGPDLQVVSGGGIREVVDLTKVCSWQVRSLLSSSSSRLLLWRWVFGVLGLGG